MSVDPVWVGCHPPAIREALVAWIVDRKAPMDFVAEMCGY